MFHPWQHGPAARLVALAMLPVLAVATSACGSGGAHAQGVASLTRVGAHTTTTTKASKDPTQAFLDFTRCMRAHGVNLPDPQFSTKAGGGTVRVGGQGVDPNSPAFKAAQTACQPLLDKAINQGGLKKPSAADQERALKFAQCMRQHGVDMPDPTFSGGGISIKAGGPNVDFNSATFQAAQKACDQYFGPAGGAKPGSGSGPVTGSSGAGSGSSGLSVSGGQG
jgi:hypothetical protein